MLNQRAVEDWLLRNYQSVGNVLMVIVFCWLISRFAHQLLSRILSGLVRRDIYATKKDREKRVDTLAGLGSAIIRFAIWGVGGITIINIAGVNTAPFLASAGVVGVALGFGAQKLINDLVSGIFIIFENQYRVGDFIEVEGVSGTVEEITIRTTVLRDLNGAVHHIPNGAIVVTTNKSMGFGQINLDLAVDPATDLKKLEAIIDKVGQTVASDPELSDEIIEAPKFVRVSDFTGNSVTIKIMGKTAGGKQLEIKSVFFAELKNALEKAHIKLAIVPVAPTAQQKLK